ETDGSNYYTIYNISDPTIVFSTSDSEIGAIFPAKEDVPHAIQYLF
ncbi:23327_t:CDS:1, partial [Dentiscutata erythropus]